MTLSCSCFCCSSSRKASSSFLMRASSSWSAVAFSAGACSAGGCSSLGSTCCISLSFRFRLSTSLSFLSMTLSCSCFCRSTSSFWLLTSSKLFCASRKASSSFLTRASPSWSAAACSADACSAGGCCSPCSMCRMSLSFWFRPSTSFSFSSMTLSCSCLCCSSSRKASSSFPMRTDSSRSTSGRVACSASGWSAFVSDVFIWSIWVFKASTSLCFSSSSFFIFPLSCSSSILFFRNSSTIFCWAAVSFFCDCRDSLKVCFCRSTSSLCSLTSSVNLSASCKASSSSSIRCPDSSFAALAALSISRIRLRRVSCSVSDSSSFFW